MYLVVVCCRFAWGDEDAYIRVTPRCRYNDTLHSRSNIWPKVTYSATLLLLLLHPNSLENLSKSRPLITRKTLQAHVMAMN